MEAANCCCQEVSTFLLRLSQAGWGLLDISSIPQGAHYSKIEAIQLCGDPGNPGMYPGKTLLKGLVFPHTVTLFRNAMVTILGGL